MAVSDPPSVCGRNALVSIPEQLNIGVGVADFGNETRQDYQFHNWKYYFFYAHIPGVYVNMHEILVFFPQ